MKQIHGLAYSLLLSAVAACAPTPRPDMFRVLDSMRESAQGQESKRIAFAAYARAENLRMKAQGAFEDGDLAGAQILAEQAQVAYERAVLVGRITRAESERLKALEEEKHLQIEIGFVDGDLNRIQSQVDALETKVKSFRDAEAIVPSKPTDASREKARMAAARALTFEAKSFCAAVTLLTVEPPLSSEMIAQLQKANDNIAELEKKLTENGPVPIDEASRMRADCLSLLTQARRRNATSSRDAGISDALLDDVSHIASVQPVRDDRGVAVVLRNVFDGNKLTDAGTKTLSDLNALAEKYPTFPMVVVVHADGLRDKKMWLLRAESIVTAFKQSRSQIPIWEANNAVALVDGQSPNRTQNNRIEIVFISPHIL